MKNGMHKLLRGKMHRKINQYQADWIADILLLAVIVTGVLSTLR
jgi:hypothetical protein